MTLKAEVVLKFPEGNRLFALKAAQTESLERACGKVGIGLIYQRVMTGTYFFADVRQVILHGAMGGGAPLDVAEEFADFIMRQPYEAGALSPFSVAKAILHAAFVGVEDIEGDSPGEWVAAKT